MYVHFCCHQLCNFEEIKKELSFIYITVSTDNRAKQRNDNFYAEGGVICVITATTVLIL